MPYFTSHFVFSVISLPCTHGLRFDGMVLVLELQTGREFFLANCMNFYFIFLDENTACHNRHTSYFRTAWNFEMFSHVLRILGRSFLFLCEPEERLHRQWHLLEEEHQHEVERLRGEHANFWRKWSEDADYPLRLATSRNRILGKTCTIPELPLSTGSSKRSLKWWKRSLDFRSSSLNFGKLNFDIVVWWLKKDFGLVCEHTSSR